MRVACPVRVMEYWFSRAMNSTVMMFFPVLRLIVYYGIHVRTSQEVFM